MGENAIRLGESVCMAAADARWIGSHLNCYRLDRMEDVGASLLLTGAGLLAAAILTCRRPGVAPKSQSAAPWPASAVIASPWDSGRLSPGIALTALVPSAKLSSRRSGRRPWSASMAGEDRAQAVVRAEHRPCPRPWTDWRTTLKGALRIMCDAAQTSHGGPGHPARASSGGLDSGWCGGRHAIQRMVHPSSRVRG